MTRKGSDYVPSPEVEAADLLRYETALAVLCGALEVTEGARRLNLSRVRFQTLLHRAKYAFVDALIPHPAGRPPKPEPQVQLEKRVALLEKDNAELREQLAMAENLFGAAGEMLRSIRQAGRSPRRSSRPKSALKSDPEPEDPDPATPTRATSSTRSTLRWPRWRQTVWRAAIESSPRWRAGRHFAALLLGVALCTLRRWRAAQRDEPPQPRRRELPSAELHAELEQLVRSTRGLIGAEALRRAVAGVSRRQAAAVKADVRAAIEHERQSRCARVTVLEPGTIRGFDAMHIRTSEGPRFLLICTDGSVPYRTTISTTESYDAEAVAATLMADMNKHGAPLAYRMDRASCHGVAKVRALLQAHQVLLLQGPPRYPRYYGQLERQNRDHRAWLSAQPVSSPADLDASLLDMLHALNWLWPRRKLEWRSPGDLWNQRPPIVQHRAALQREVADRLAALSAQPDLKDKSTMTLERLAIEQVLQANNIISIQPGARC